MTYNGELISRRLLVLYSQQVYLTLANLCDLGQEGLY